MPRKSKVRSSKIYNPKTKRFVKNSSGARKRIKSQRGKVKNVVINASKRKVAKQNVIKNMRRMNSQMKAQNLERDLKVKKLEVENRKKDKLIAKMKRQMMINATRAHQHAKKAKRKFYVANTKVKKQIKNFTSKVYKRTHKIRYFTNLDNLIKSAVSAPAKSKYKYTYKINVGTRGNATNGRNRARRNNFSLNGENYNGITNTFIIASRRKLPSGAFLNGSNELFKLLKDSGNQSFMTQMKTFDVSQFYDAIKISNEMIIQNHETDLTNAVLYNATDIAVSTTHNFFGIKVDQRNKTFESNISIKTDIPEACWYNAIMYLANKINNYYSKKKTITIEKVKIICGTENRSDMGMTIKEALKFFQKYNISLKCYNGFFHSIFKWDNNGKKNRHFISSFSCLVNNNHVYPIRDRNVCSSLTQKNRDIDDVDLKMKAPSSHFYIMNKEENKIIQNVHLFVKCNKMSDIFENIFTLEEKHDMTIVYTDDLIDVVKELINHYGITPQIRGGSSISEIKIIIGDDCNFIKIVSLKHTALNEEVLNKITIEDYNLYMKEKEEIGSILIDEQHKSDYSESLYNAFDKYSRSPIKGLFEGIDALKKVQVNGVDIAKSYASILNDMKYFPIFSIFDVFEKYDGGEIDEYSLYIVSLEEKFAGYEIIFNKSEVMVYGCTLLMLRREVFKISAVNKPFRKVRNPLFGEIKQLFDKKDYHIALKKFMINSNIGYMGKKNNKFSNLIVSTDQKYINNLCKRYGEFGETAIPYENEGLWFYHNEDMTMLINGFHPIQYLIYDIQRLTTFETYKEVLTFTTPVAVNTDCVYYLPNEKLNQYVLDKYDGSFGNKKLETKKLYLQTYIFDNDDEGLCIEEDGSIYVEEDNIIQNITQNHIHIEDEYDLKEIEKKAINKTIFTSDLPGSSKSYCMQTIYKKALFICPYNKMTYILKEKQLKGVTAHKLLGAGVDGNRFIKSKPFDLTGIECIVFEEIYSYDLKMLMKIYTFMEKNDNINFFANGDPLQIPSINLNCSMKYIDRCIKMMFPNLVNFKIHKRDLSAGEFLHQLKKEIFTPDVDLIALCKKYFPVVKKKDIVEKAICYYNDTCIEINNTLMNKIRGHNDIIVGDTLLCKERLKRKIGIIHTNFIYNVIKVDGEMIHINEPVDDITFYLKKETIHNHFRFEFSETAHSVQGLTFGDKITICDVNKSNHWLTPEWIWVAITRSNNIRDNISICTDVIHNNVLQNLKTKLKGHEVYDKKNGFIFDAELYPRCDKTWVHETLNNQRGRCAECRTKLKTYWSFARDLRQYSINRTRNSFRGGHCQSNANILCLSCQCADINH